MPTKHAFRTVTMTSAGFALVVTGQQVASDRWHVQLHEGEADGLTGPQQTTAEFQAHAYVDIVERHGAGLRCTLTALSPMAAEDRALVLALSARVLQRRELDAAADQEIAG